MTNKGVWRIYSNRDPHIGRKREREVEREKQKVEREVGRRDREREGGR
jgi:hypothetical protein